MQIFLPLPLRGQLRMFILSTRFTDNHAARRDLAAVTYAQLSYVRDVFGRNDPVLN
jgi:hypothetical protein